MNTIDKTNYPLASPRMSKQGKAKFWGKVKRLNMNTHTPGPWYTASTGNHQGLIISEHKGENVAVSYDKKDAALLAAAPELAEALRELADHIDARDAAHYHGSTPVVMRARAALAKAGIE